jgi:multidrug transporter EmrE-like cation transporter
MSVTGMFLVTCAAAITMIANLLMRAGLQRGGGFSPADVTAVLPSFFKLLLDPLFAVGFVGYFAAALVWFRVLSTEPLSLAYPVLVAMTFLMVTSGAALLFQEPVSLRKLIGLILIVVGIAVTSTN